MSDTPETAAAGAEPMATPDVTPPPPRETYLNADRGILSWLLTKDHKRIAVMFMVALLAAFGLGGLFAMLVRIELLTPNPDIVDALGYNRLFTLHGITMIFLFLVPSIPAIFGNFCLPIMIGAQDVAFPRLNLATFYIYVFGACFVLWAMIHGGTDTGWTFYTPYSSTTPTMVVPVLLGVFILGMGSILSGLNFMVTVHTLRAPGLTWMRMPLFVWAIYGVSFVQVLATPVLGITVLLVAVEHAFQLGIFDPARGGDPVLMQHLFWFYSHPAVYIMILPSMGVISEVVAAFSRKNPFGYKAIAYSTFGIAVVGFFVWGHHMFIAGQSKWNAGAFGVLSMIVGVFTAIKVFNWVATMYKGSISFRTPFAYVCGFLFFVVFGGMTGVALATVGPDVHWTDTYFVIAHFHFIMVGAALMAFLAALHYWFPKMFGRMYPEGWGLVSAVLIILGFNATFIPQFLLGNAGMPRRYYHYPAEFQALNVASTAGASLLAFGFLIILIYLLYSLKFGPRAPQNPWHSRGFEWLTLTPPVKHNFTRPVTFGHGPHDYTRSDAELVPQPDREEDAPGAHTHSGHEHFLRDHDSYEGETETE